MGQLLGIVSDSHDNVAALAAVADGLRHRGILDVVHCGDVCDGGTLDLLAGFRVRVCLGNNDSARDLARAAARIGGSFAPELDIEIGGKRMYVAHGDRWSVLDAVVQAGKHDYLFHGHTHVPRDERLGTTRVINPGALHRAAAWTWGVLDLAGGALETVTVPR
jgi:putative phosphoesterase